MQQRNRDIKHGLLLNWIINFVNNVKYDGSEQERTWDTYDDLDVIDKFTNKAYNNDSKKTPDKSLLYIVFVYFILSFEWSDVFIKKSLKPVNDIKLKNN